MRLGLIRRDCALNLLEEEGLPLCERMAKILINGLDHYYELAGEGPALVFIHGAFADSQVWDSQWRYFSRRYQVLRYDLRGHGRTGRSDLDRYTMETFAEDLFRLLQSLKIDCPAMCGLSWGGSIAQVFAVRHPDRLRSLVLVGSTISMSVSFGEKLLRYILFPKSAMTLAIRTLKVEQFVRFSLWLSNLTLGRDWLEGDGSFLEYLRRSMLQIDREEYRKIWSAIYGFDLQPLEQIRCPTYVITGEGDARMVQRHAAEILRRVPSATRRIFPGSNHAVTMQQPDLFNRELESFLCNPGKPPTPPDPEPGQAHC